MGRVNKDNIVAMIPVRMGSTRLAVKNLALVGGKPLVYYSIKAAKDAGIFDRIVLNGEDPLFGSIAKRYGVEFYRRPAPLGGSTAKSDQVMYDFMKNIPSDIAVWVNTIAPLRTGHELAEIVYYFIAKKLDSLITVKNEQVHCLYKNRPVNFRRDGLFAQTQDLIPVQPFVYSVMMWRSGVFKKNFEEKGHAFFCGRCGFYPVSRMSSIIIKTGEDLAMVDYIMRGRSGKHKYKVLYDKVLT